MNVQDRVVIGRDDFGDVGPVESEIRPSRVGPPGIECCGVELCSVTSVVEPQTEARATQSKRPDLRVLAMTALRPFLPLVRQV